MNKLGYCATFLILASVFAVTVRADDATPGASTPAADAPAPDNSVPAAGAAAPAPESSAPSTADVFDDRFYFAPMGSYGLAPSGHHLDNGYGGRLVVGKSVVPHIGVELIGSYLNYPGKPMPAATGLVCSLGPTLCPTQPSHYPDSDVGGVGAGVNGFLFRSNHGLYVHADGLGGSKFTYEGGLGYDLPLFEQGFGVRVEALYHKEKSLTGEPLFNLGLFIPFGDLPAPPVAPAPEPVAVVPVQQPPPPPPPPPCQTPAPGERINLEGCKTGDTLVLRGVNFEFNSASLTVDAKIILDQVVSALTSRTDLKIELDGHTDGIGSVRYNQKLSERRADSVKAYLVSKGIDDGRLTTQGFGKSRPIADNKTDEGRELNRRVELKVIDSGGSVDVPVSSGASDNTAAPTPASGGTSAAAPSVSDSPPPSNGEASPPTADMH